MTTITLATTALPGKLQQAWSDLEAHVIPTIRDNITEAVADDTRSDRIVTLATSLACAEEQRDYFEAAANIVQNDGDLTGWLLREYGRDADDRWSGRNNDLRRSIADARHDTLNKIAGWLRMAA